MHEHTLSLIDRHLRVIASNLKVHTTMLPEPEPGYCANLRAIETDLRHSRKILSTTTQEDTT